MTRGLSRDQLGVTEQMIRVYGERIWELSNNIQLRRGDPIRLLDWDQIEAQRPGRGMADNEIAEEIGLTRDQVLYIRLLQETRRFRRDQYHRLYDLGGGRRFRRERFVPHEERPGFGAEAMALRAALDFDPRSASGYLRRGSWNGDTTARWLERWARETPDRPALLAPDGAMNHGRVMELSLRLANVLFGLGIRRGDALAVDLPNSVEFVLTYFASGLLGAVFCAMPEERRDEAWAAMPATVTPRLAICPASDVAHDRPGLEHVIVVGEATAEATHSFWEVVDEHDPIAIGETPVASDPAVLCFTSGKSGPPRPVLHNYHTLLSNCRAIAPLYGLGSDDGVLCALPYSHAIGLGTINLALHAGSATIVPEATDPAGIATATRDRAAAVLFAEPDGLAAIVNGGALDRGDLSSLRRVTAWGKHCPERLARTLDEGLPQGSVAQIWGTTECLIALHSSFDGAVDLRCGVHGTMVESFDARIVSPSGSILAAGREGELEVQGSSVFAGYPGDAKTARAPFSPDGWFRTGDLAIMDERGALRITGRVDWLQ